MVIISGHGYNLFFIFVVLNFTFISLYFNVTVYCAIFWPCCVWPAPEVVVELDGELGRQGQKLCKFLRIRAWSSSYSFPARNLLVFSIP